ncbi:MAG: hypothetical protein JRN62_02960 [Nitrososphaerota archaeon]|jgi:hypothetical protein|nr:hypothetical protein [Nitrososphaerota archaeon]MDG6948954.1 hypothetical protein [Nitrososphaerota archaeon]
MMRRLTKTKQETVQEVTVQNVKQEICMSPYHRHNSLNRGGDYDECTKGGEHLFRGAPHRLIGQRMPYYDCVKCMKAAVVLYKCSGRSQ